MGDPMRHYIKLGQAATMRFIHHLVRLGGYKLIKVEHPDQFPSLRDRIEREIDECYEERPEVGPVNLKVKLERASRGGPFENPGIVKLNKAVANLAFQTGAKRIVELGGGTGCFASEIAKADCVQITCSEFDMEAHQWAVANRPAPNVTYISNAVSASDGPFDLLVSIEVVEHIFDFSAFLSTCAGLAPAAIITTPNKNRSVDRAFAAPPLYHQHVREWSAGEFYWVLRNYFDRVMLYTLTPGDSLDLVRIKLTDPFSPLIAYCTEPRR